MLCYNKTDVSEGMHISETNELHEYIFCHYNYF